MSKYIEHFKGRDTEGKGTVGKDREIHYRDYGKTLEEQKKLSWIINSHQDSSVCVKSALMLMKDEYSILWELGTKTIFKEQMDELLKDKICYKNNI